MKDHTKSVNLKIMHTLKTNLMVIYVSNVRAFILIYQLLTVLSWLKFFKRDLFRLIIIKVWEFAISKWFLQLFLIRFILIFWKFIVLKLLVHFTSIKHILNPKVCLINKINYVQHLIFLIKTIFLLNNFSGF